MKQNEMITDPIKLKERIDKIKTTIRILERKIWDDEWSSGEELDELFDHLDHEKKELFKFENRLKALEAENDNI
jgi:hypothetical protein